MPNGEQIQQTTKGRPGGYLPYIVLAFFLLLFIFLLALGNNRGQFIIQAAPSLVVVAFLIVTFRLYRFTNTSYLLAAFSPIFGAIIAANSAYNWPFDGWGLWGVKLITDSNLALLGSFAGGLYGYLLAEYCQSKRMIGSKLVLYTFPICVMITIGVLWQMIDYSLLMLSTEAAVSCSDWQLKLAATAIGSGVAIEIFFWIRGRKV